MEIVVDVTVALSTLLKRGNPFEDLPHLTEF